MKGGATNSIVSLICTILLLPVFFLLFVLGIVIWLALTFSGIGPLVQFFCNREDDKILDRHKILLKCKDLRIVTVPGEVNAASKGKEYQVMLRYTEPSEPSRFPPVCIPNGLGATMVAISNIHEALVMEGFRVLSFDRLGVGFSDANTTGISPTAQDVVQELDFVMNSVLPSKTEWILLGPSMGSIIGQCYVATYPAKVVGFLNMDGLPFPFKKFRSSFMGAAKIYKVYTYVIWTGIFRPFIGMLLSKPDMKWVISSAFGIEIMQAQMNRTSFYSNLAVEMETMMSCCEYAATGWGRDNILLLDQENLQALTRAEPSESVSIVPPTSPTANAYRVITVDRSSSEIGENWATQEQVQQALSKLGNIVADKEIQVSLLSNQTDPTLSRRWKNLVVRVMSGRNHDFGNPMANSFYTQEMKDLSAAEHTIHWMLAKNGCRTVYPHLNHMQMAAQTKEIVIKTKEIGLALMH